jgi:hypothetical protein
VAAGKCKQPKGIDGRARYFLLDAGVESLWFALLVMLLAFLRGNGHTADTSQREEVAHMVDVPDIV